MSTEATATIPEVKHEETTEVTAAEPTPLEQKTEASPAIDGEVKKEADAEAEVPAAADATSPAPAEDKTVEESTAEAKPEEPKKEDGRKSPSFIARILAPFKQDRSKVKAPKSPKEKKVEPVPVAEEPAKDEAAPAPAQDATEAAKSEEAPAEVVKDAEPTAPITTEAVSTSAASETKEEKPEEKEKEAKPEEKEVKHEKETAKAIKVGRRLSSRVTNLFKPRAKEDVSTPAKVDENPPKIDEPAPVAPLDNPAAAAGVTEATSEPVKEEVVDESKPVEPAPAVVAAAA